MYDIAYQFDADPFRLSPDHRFCFRHRSYAKSKAYLDYALTRGEGFVMITGSPGSGKTTLLNDVLSNADNTNRAMARIVTTQLDDKDLLRMVAFSFKLDMHNLDKASILHHLEKFLVKQYQLHRHSLLIIDEAQDLDKTALEEIRLLTNLQIDGNSLLQVFLVGQNNLMDMILDPTMEQLHQRLIASSHLEAMKAEETEIYVLHRLRMAGWKQDPLISRGALRRIHIFSRGVPRIVNQLCSRFLLYGSVENKHKLDSHDVQEVITELCNEHLAPVTGDQFPGSLFNDNSPAEEMASLEQYDQEFLDSTAFSNKKMPNKPLDQHPNASNVHHIFHAGLDASERRDVMREPESKKETKLNSQVSSISYDPSTHINTLEIDDTNRIPSSSGKTDDKRASQNRRVKKRQPYALAGFLVVLFFGIFILAFPESTGKQVAELNNKLTSGKDSSHQSGQLKQNEKLDLVSIQNNIKDSLIKNAVHFTQTKQGVYKLQLNVDEQFSWGNAIMSHALQTKLGYLAEAMRDQPQAVIHIIGHTDPTGSQGRNNLLSKLRAKVVANYLVLQGIPQHRLTTDGRGSSELVNTTNPPVNRRVDLLIEIIKPTIVT